jgi:hypothetical protein
MPVTSVLPKEGDIRLFKSRDLEMFLDTVVVMSRYYFRLLKSDATDF